jgi:hypothetical protein
MYSIGIAYLLWACSFFGCLGLHRFYLGKIATGILWMCTGGFFTIGTIYDLFTLPRQVQEANIRKALGTPRQPEVRTRYVSDGETRYVRPETEHKESLERIILKLAKENKGILTVSEVALSANIPIDDAKKCLESLVSKGMAELRVRRTGALVYVMQDFTDHDEPLEDF